TPSSMFVEHILPRARERLALIDVGASIAEAARQMQAPETELLVVWNGQTASGVITKTDILKLVCSGAADFSAPVSTIMSADVTACAASALLRDVWSAMSSHRFQRVPVLSENRRPVGIVYARDALQALLKDAEYEDAVLRAYVQGVGYH